MWVWGLTLFKEKGNQSSKCSFLKEFMFTCERLDRHIIYIYMPLVPNLRFDFESIYIFVPFSLLLCFMWSFLNTSIMLLYCSMLGPITKSQFTIPVNPHVVDLHNSCKIVQTRRMHDWFLDLHPQLCKILSNFVD